MKKNIMVMIGLLVGITINIHAMLTEGERAFMGDTSPLNSQYFVAYIEKKPDLYGESQIYGIPYSEMIYQMRVAVFSKPKTKSAYIMLKDKLHIFPLGGFQKYLSRELKNAIRATIDDCYRYLLDHIANGSAYIPEHFYGYKVKEDLESGWEEV